MNYRRLGKTGYEVSEVSLGTWQIGAGWGDIKDEQAIRLLHTAIDQGINLFDTADVYGDGRSEKLIAAALRDRSVQVFIATKVGRRLDPHIAEGYNEANLTSFVERSLSNLQRDALDLVQLHCPPTAVYYLPEVFGALDKLKQAGKIRHYGVSVEKVEEALKAIEYPGVATVQIIFNLFRQRPFELYFPQARHRDVGILVRVPLASGLLGGRINRSTEFAPNDHRSFNRQGEKFDRGETFAGVDLEKALTAVEAIRAVVPKEVSLPAFALRWILQFPEVSCVIPGARNEEQVVENVRASEIKAPSNEQQGKLRRIYEEQIAPLVHHRW
jgi:aryl-alcohol dehydrogenase-like predicted oxidoreductase